MSRHYLRVRLVLTVPIKSLYAQNYCSATLIGKTSLRIHQHEIGTHIIRKLLCMYFYYSSTNGKFKNSFNRTVFCCRTSLVPEISCGMRNVTSKFTALLTCRQNDFVMAGIERSFRLCLTKTCYALFQLIQFLPHHMYHLLVNFQ